MAIVLVTKENFQKEVLESDQPVLVDFWATWCGPCQMAAPILEEVSKEHPEIKVCKINVDEEQELAMKYEVSAIPAFLCFQGGSVKEQAVGLQSKDDLVKLAQV